MEAGPLLSPAPAGADDACSDDGNPDRSSQT